MRTPLNTSLLLALAFAATPVFAKLQAFHSPDVQPGSPGLVSAAEDPAQPTPVDPAEIAALAESSLEDAREQLAKVTAELHPELTLAYTAQEDEDIDVTAPEPPEPPGSTFQQRLHRIITQPDAGKASVSLLRSSDLDKASADQLQEDLAVMSRLLDKAVSDKAGNDRHRQVLGVELLMLTGESPARAVYLEDYGVIFTLPVQVALLPSPAKVDDLTKAAVDEDSEWEQARREIKGGTAPRAFDPLEGINLDWTQRAVADYDEAKVKRIQEAVLQSLKNASRIRQLKPDQYVLVCLTGPGAAGAESSRKVVHARAEVRTEVRSSGTAAPKVMVVDRENTGVASGSNLTIRIRKSDADAFAKGSIDLQEFRNRARIATYPGSSARFGASRLP